MTNYPEQLTGSWALFKPALAAVKENFAAVAIMIILPNVIFGLALRPVTNSTSHKLHLSAGLLTLVLISSLWLLLNAAVFYWYQLHSLKHGPVSIAESYRKGLSYVPRLIGLSLICGFLTFGGLILFIVPGLIVIRRYAFAVYYLIDRNMNIRTTMKTSAAESKQYSGYVWGTLGVSILIFLILSIFSAILSFMPLSSYLSGIITAAFGAIIEYMYLFRYLQIKKASAADRV